MPNHPASNRIVPAHKRSIPVKKLLIVKISTISVWRKVYRAFAGQLTIIHDAIICFFGILVSCARSTLAPRHVSTPLRTGAIIARMRKAHLCV